MASFDLSAAKAFKAEGGYQADPADNANYCDGKLVGTNRGISAVAYKGYYKKCPTVEDMKRLTVNQALAIYKAGYWDKINGDRIKNQSVADLMFQYIIGSGASQLSDLKAIANTTAGKKQIAEIDTSITAREAEIINSLNQATYHNNLKVWRAAFFKRLVERVPEKRKFLQGWLNRLETHKFDGVGSTTRPFNPKYIYIGVGLALTGAMAYQYSKSRRRLAA